MRKITEQLSEKDANQQISKKVFSANIRNKRTLFVPKVGQEFPSNWCRECGFHIRSKNHAEGSHHNGIVKLCHRGR